jgi:phage terminase large subunit GpA-like protein
MSLTAARREALRALIPPKKLRLSEWIEGEVRLPAGVSALPGPVQLWPFQREIADAIGDPAIERVTLVKPVRVGFTTLLTAALGGSVANDPGPILCLLPTEADCRDYVVSDIEPVFAATPSLAAALSDDQQEGERNTLLSRRFAGGSLKVVAAKAPRNLRRHNVRYLFMDEVDGMEVTSEGSPILLAEKRTMSFPDRKIVMGSTPVLEDTSYVLRAYAQSDMRVFEVPCPDCDTWHEMQWDQIRWDEGRPETARWCCPSCGSLVTERHKAEMVRRGGERGWRATRPEVAGHAGFRMNALVSLHANASWAKLAQEFLASKGDPVTLQTFVNTILAQGWSSGGEEIDEGALAGRAEAWGIDSEIPAEVLLITAGLDVQHDRIEIAFLGWTEGGGMLVLGHEVVWGAWSDDDTWADVDEQLGRQFRHALGGAIGLDAACIDAGDGTTMERVLAFCRGRRRVMAIKGAPGNRPVMERSKSHGGKQQKLWIVGVDTAKSQLFAAVDQIRFSDELPPVWFEQFASERAVVRYVRGQPVRRFERAPGRRAEALDCTVYGMAARKVVTVDWDARRFDVSRDAAPRAAVKPAAPKIRPRQFGGPGGSAW